MRLMLYKRIVTLSVVHQKPSKAQLKEEPYVRLLASRSNVVVALAKVQGDAGTSTQDDRHRREDKARVKIVVIIDGSAKVPSHPTPLTVAEVVGLDQPVVWPCRRMTLSNESDQSLLTPEVAQTQSVTTIQQEDDLDVALQQAGVLPDETTLASYPDRPPNEDNDDIDFVIVSHHENGTVALNEGDVSVFERNGVKGDPFHYLKRLYDTWKKNHGFNKEARGLVRDAIMIPNPEQVNALIPILEILTGSFRAQKSLRNDLRQ
mmetsp:Transcript_3351/g.6982  ORF Transcript_3351/g.6982 Transcript_3351/m.6982 type:complete len:262 (+) Transcript_3351:3-788(+)